jgi:hypothetical protein
VPVIFESLFYELIGWHDRESSAPSLSTPFTLSNQADLWLWAPMALYSTTAKEWRVNGVKMSLRS